MGSGEASVVAVSTVVADAASLFDPSLFLLLPDFCFAGGCPSAVEPRLTGSEEPREGGTKLGADIWLDVDGIGIGGMAESAAEGDSKAGVR